MNGEHKASPAPDSLPPIACEVDRALCAIDDQLDWLWALSPLDTHGLWESFRRSGYRHVPEFEYPETHPGLHRLRRRLLALPVEDVEQAELQALLWEKQRELDRQVELVELRGTSGFLPASIDLWGAAETALLETAEAVLAGVPPERQEHEMAGCETVCREAQRHIDEYRTRDPAFAATVHVVEDLSAKLMVSRGDLYVARDIRVAADQVPPLIHHEIGTHSLTRHNGSRQPLEQLECGLAHYHSLQEGLGVLAEYLSGHLSPSRVRVLAARVVATHHVCEGESVADIFHHLVDTHSLVPDEAFNVALRVGRGGGMTKDAVYLRGLQALVEHLHTGEPLDFLFVGKLALAHLPTLHDLEHAGYVAAPALLPMYLDSPKGQARLERCRSASLLDLVTEEVRS